MNIVIGRGSKRVVHELPGGSFMAEAAKAEPKEYNALHANICMLAGIEPNAAIDYAGLRPDFGRDFQERRARRQHTQQRKPIEQSRKKAHKSHKHQSAGKPNHRKD